MLNKIILYLIVISSLFACNNNVFYESSLEIPEQVWESDKAAVFDFNINDTSQVFDLFIDILNTDEYRNSNLWLFVYTSSEVGKIAADTLEYTLTDGKGKWLGKKNGDVHISNFIYKANIKFPKEGKYTVEIIQGMRDLKLKGIKQVGFKIKKQSGKK